jgi:hypothetical protein
VIVRGLFVGIDEYAISRRNLEGCVNDVEYLSAAMQPVLQKTVKLTNADATRKNILREIHNTLEESDPGDLFVFFCACHGATKYGEFFLEPHDHDGRRFLANALLFQDIANSMGHYAHVNTLTIIDACKAGAIGFDPARHNCGQLSSIVAASASLEASNEFERYGRPHGMFAYGLAHTLNRFWKRTEESISIAELFDGAYSYTKKRSTEANDGYTQPQHPVMVGTLPADLTMRKPPKRESQTKKKAKKKT